MLRVLKKILKEPAAKLIGLLKFCVFAVSYRKKRRKKECVMVFLRDNKTDSDTFPLLEYLNNNSIIKTIFVVSTNKSLSDQYLQLLKPLISKEIVVITKKNIPKYLALCNLAFTKNKNDLRGLFILRRFAGLKIIHIFHGPVTKNVGLLRNDRKYKEGVVNYADAYVTQSYAEKYYRCTTSLLNPKRVFPIGYPRFFRASQFLSNQTQPIITTEGKLLLEKRPNCKKILYAPTHRKEQGLENEFFTEEFNSLLERINAVLIIRLHAIDKRNISDSFRYINADNILTLPSNCVPGSIELIPMVDCLITDYSSIFLEGIACKVPTIFLFNEKDDLFKSRGLAFEKDIALPGPKVSSAKELCPTISQVIKTISQKAI